MFFFFHFLVLVKVPCLLLFRSPYLSFLTCLCSSLFKVYLFYVITMLTCQRETMG
jgi:hypothetical protein